MTKITSRQKVVRGDSTKTVKTKMQTVEEGVVQDKIGKSKVLVGRRAMPAVLRILVSVLLLVIFAGIITWFILLQQNKGDVAVTGEFVQKSPVLVGYSYTIVLLVMCVITSAVWRPVLGIGISFVLASIVMYINTQKVNYRNAPLLPEDFLLVDQAGTIVQFIDPWSVARLVTGSVLVLVGCGIIDYGLRRMFGRQKKGLRWGERYAVIPRVAFTLVAASALMLFARPILHYDDKDGESAEWITGLKFERWNQKEDFEHNGYVIAFLYSLGGFHEAEPDGYSESKMAEIEDKYRSLADELNQKQKMKSLAEVADNVIFVLDESFMDPEILGELYEHTGGDVTPNLHEIFEKYPSGYMYSPGYGGGTANIEFEVLTGLSNYWAQTTPYVTALSKFAGVPGITNDANSDGFSATAIHSFDGSMYKRNAVYGRMGFKVLLDQNSMTHTKHENNGGYISDQEAYAEVLDVLKDGEDKHMIMLATMQNHAPYDAAKYDESNFKPVNDIVGYGWMEAYLETIHHADQYLGEFVKELDKLKERTVMVWFGDHAPAVLDEYANAEDPELVDLAHLTPYFVYANFELDNPFTEKEVTELNMERGFEYATEGVDLPTVTPNCFMSILYDMLEVKRTPLVYLTSRICEDTPVLAPTYSGISAVQETEELRDYQMINYDILSGKRYWIK